MLLLGKIITFGKFFDFANIFSKNLVEILLKDIMINKHLIKLKKDKKFLHKFFTAKYQNCLRFFRFKLR